MKRTKGSQSEVGMLYQYGVTALLAAQLSGNNHVEDYIIYSSENSAGKFDDIVARVKLKNQDDWYLYLIQAKYKDTKRLNVSDNIRGKRIEYFLTDYIQSFNDILNNPNLTCRHGIPNDNIKFYIFCDKAIQIPVFLRQDCTFQLSVCLNIEKGTTNNNVPSPFGNKYWKFVCKDLAKSEFHQQFFDKCCLYLEQANYSKLNKLIADACQIRNTKDIINYVKDYFNDDYLYAQGLRKEIFEIELQKIRLLDAIPPLTSFEELIDDNRITTWNEITIKHDVTTINSTENFSSEPCLYSCLIQKINNLLDTNINGETLISLKHNLSNELIQKFLTYSERKRLRYWIDKPLSIRSLMIELWKYGDVPLILKTHMPLSNIERYAHLKRSYIILDDWTNRSEEINNSKMNIFTSLSSIADSELRDQILSDTVVSPQGRKPVSLKNLLRDDAELMSALTCVDMLRTMRKRTPYLKEAYYRGSDYLVFIIEDEGCDEISDRIEPYAIGHNFRITCPPGQTEECSKMIREHMDIFPHYTIYRLRKIGEKLILTHGIPQRLNPRFVDQYGEPLFISNIDECIPIIGQTIELNELNYIPRQLRRATLPRSFFTTQEMRICVLSGDVDSLKHTIKLNNIDDIINKTLPIENKTYFVSIQEKETPQDYWRKLCHLRYPIFDVCIRGGVLELLRFKNCKNLNFHISYDGGIYSEQDFFNEIPSDTREIAVVTGDAGIGKSSFLKWLCNNYSTQDYIIFYDLINLQVDLNKSERQGIDLIDFIFKETQRGLPKQYIDFVSNLRRKKKLIWVLDSFDEIQLACEKQVLNLIRIIADSGAQIVIATRVENCKILMDQFDIRLIKIEPLKEEDCLSYWELDRELLMNISTELATNPLYLKFLKIISANREDLADITKYTLYEKVINMKVKHCLRATYQIVNNADIEQAVLLLERLALVALFGKEIIEKELYWECDTQVFDMTKYGIVSRFTEDNYPIFHHRSFVEFLFAQWIAKACKINMYKSTAKYLYQKLITNNELHILNILFEDNKLHNAILEGNVIGIERIAADDPECWSSTDKLGRTALHAAAIYFSYSDIITTSMGVLELVVTAMLQTNADMDKTDIIMNWDWSEYVQRKIFNFSYSIEEVGVMKIYLRLNRRKVEKYSYPFATYPPNHFHAIFALALTFVEIDMISDLVVLQNFENKVFYNFHQACLGLTPETTSWWTADSQFEGRLTPLHVACIYGSFSMVQHLIKTGADVNIVDAFHCTPLHYSIMRCGSFREGSDYEKRKIIEIVKLLLDEGANPHLDFLGSSRVTPLCLAVKMKSIDVVLMLLEAKACIFERYKNQNTLLHLAVSLRCVDIVKCLLRHGILRYLKNEENMTALDIAVKQNHTEMIELLSENETTASISTEEMRPVWLNIEPPVDTNKNLHHAACYDNIELMKILLRKGKNINVLNKKGDTPLLTALRTNNVEASTFLLSEGADFRIIDKYGKTPLFLAAQNDNIAAAEMLLQRGDDANIADFYKLTPLHVALMNNNINIAKLLLKNGSDANAQNVCDWTPLHSAVSYGSDDSVALLLENGANPNIPDETGSTPLHFSVRLPRRKCSVMLLRKGANVNFQDNFGWTPLLVAVNREDIDTVRLLLENGANLHDKNMDGFTPLFYASKAGNTELMRLLVEKGANINAKNMNGISILMYAAKYEQMTSIEFLLKANVDIDTIGGTTALIYSILERDINLVRSLLVRGARVNAYDNRYGSTPLLLAAIKGDEDIVSLLLENGAHVNANCGRRFTPLHQAVMGEHHNIVKLLIDRGANVNFKSEDRKTVLLYAIRTRNVPIVDLLLQADADNTKEDRLTALLYSIFLRDINIIQLLLSKGVDLNIYNEIGFTPLYISTAKKYGDIVQILLGHGADVNIMSHKGRIPFVKAVIIEDIEITRLLLNNGANVNVSLGGFTALHLKAVEGNFDFVKLLIEKGADVNMKAEDGITALELAVAHGRTDIVEFLLENKADGNMQTVDDVLRKITLKRNINYGMSCNVEDNKNVNKTLFWAAGEGHLKLIQLYLHYEAKINVQNSYGYTPLHVAVFNNNEDIVEMLLGYGADVNLKTNDGLTPLCLAELKGHKNIIELITGFKLSLVVPQ